MKPALSFDTDARRRVDASILRVTLVVALVVASGSLLTMFLLGPLPGVVSGAREWRMGAMGGAVLLVFVALTLLRRGWTHLAAAIFMTGLYAGMVFGAIRLELGVHAAGLGFFTFLIMLGGFLLRPAAATAIALLGAATVFGLFWIEKTGLIAGPTPQTRPQSILLATAYIAIFLAVGWVTACYARIFKDNIASLEEAQLESERLNRELQERTVQAEAANVAKSQFLATMSHEIRTPMNAVLGMAQLLMLHELSETERHEYVRIILNSGKTLLTLLNDILDLSKVEAGKLELNLAVFAPEQVLEEVSAIFSEQAAGKGLALSTSWTGEAEARYRSDPIRLRQMLANLVSNAIKFADAGSVRIEAGDIQRQGQQALLSFAVTDSGAGLSKEEQERLFQPFSQIDNSNTRRHGGTGLGLSIVRNLARLMGGDVGIQSAPGQGATFWFRVLVETVGASEESRTEERTAVAWQGQPSTKRILIVEDVLVNRRVIEGMLKECGYGYRSVEDGQAAVEAVTGGETCDLVLMDCQMPVMDGFEATGRIRAWEQEHGRPRLPIVALTAGAFDENRQRCLAAGMDDFLVKPVDMTQLQTAIEQRFKRGR